jgi:tRNA dimethylallyltransferase
MLDIVTPGEDFNVARFQQMVERHIVQINDRGKVPVLVGGTGLYIRAVLDHYDFTPPGGDPSRRMELQEIAEKHGNRYLADMLKKTDRAAAERIHPNDRRRLIRALEVYYSTGRPISEFRYKAGEMLPKYNLAYFGLTMEREKLYKRIEQRVDDMISKGLVDEVKRLVEMGYGEQNTAMQALGYRELLDYLKGLCSLEEAVVLIKRNTRRFAKRQLTWFRRDTRIEWKNVDTYDSLEEIADEITAKAEGLFAKT